MQRLQKPAINLFLEDIYLGKTTLGQQNEILLYIKIKTKEKGKFHSC